MTEFVAKKPGTRGDSGCRGAMEDDMGIVSMRLYGLNILMAHNAQHRLVVTLPRCRIGTRHSTIARAVCFEEVWKPARQSPGSGNGPKS